MRRRTLPAVCALAVALSWASAWAAAAAAQTGPPPPRLVNGDAENGMAGWRGAGFGTLSGDGDAPSVGAGVDATSLFAAPSDAAVWQDVDLSDLASAIDQGRQPYSFGALLGGRGGLTGGAFLVAQPLSGTGAPLGAPVLVGPPTGRDRQQQTALLSCFVNATAPVGTRSVRVTIEAAGHGLADDVWLSQYPAARPAIGLFRPGFVWIESEGRGCDRHFEPIVPPAVDSLVVMPAANRCGRPAALRFRIDPRWRTSVRTLAIAARGKQVERAASEPIDIAGPRRTLRVGIRVTMEYGRGVRTVVRSFSACPARRAPQ